MLKIKDVVVVDSLEQAYELNQKRTNRIIGGMLWMRMSNTTVQKGIDLSALGLNKIEETEEEFSIGCMVTLRELELHERLNTYSQGLVKMAVEDIVGVQFRNMATIGGSIYGRFGFSDVLTAFLVMDTYVELYKGGIIPLAEFAKKKKDNDILVRVIVKKEKGRFSYQTFRNTKTDFPVLAVALAKTEAGVRASIGARPAKADVVFLDDLTEDKIKEVADSFTYGKNIRASAEYRRHLASVLLKRALKVVEKEEN